MLRKGYIKLKGSSLVEVLIALAVMSVCISLATLIYLRIQQSSLPFFKVKAVELAEQYMQETLDQVAIFEHNFSSDEFTIKRSIAASQGFPDCLLVRIMVFDASKKKVWELESVMRTPYN